MKSINYTALNYFEFEDLGVFLSWLNENPTGEARIERVRRTPPVRSSKLSPVLRVLEQLGLIQMQKDHFSITPEGREYLQKSVSDQKASLREFFLEAEEIERVTEQLDLSMTGRLPLHMAGFAQITEEEIQTALRWANDCLLFGYDKKKNEIFRIN